jgi:hypothetical protein
VETDLGLDAWLDAILEPIKKCSSLDQGLEGEVELPFSNIPIRKPPLCDDLEYLRDPIASLHHQLTFDIIFNANVTPTWKLVRVSTNTSPLFGATRTDHSNLILSFAPKKEGPHRVAKISGAGKRAEESGPTRIEPEAQAITNYIFLGSQIRSGFFR